MREKRRIDTEKTAAMFSTKLKETGYTQQRLAKMAGLNQSRISRITTKEFVRLSPKQLRAFEILGIEPVHLPQDNLPRSRAEIHETLDEWLVAEPHLEQHLLRLLKAGLALRKG